MNRKTRRTDPALWIIKAAPLILLVLTLLLLGTLVLVVLVALGIIHGA